jgi:type I restriction enzyme S subunit
MVLAMKPSDALPAPEDWGKTTVSESIEIKRGITWSKDQEFGFHREGAHPVIRIGNVQKRLELDDLIYISGLKERAIDSKRVNQGWTILVGSNGNRKRIGNAVFIQRETDFLFASFLIGAKPFEKSGLTSDFFFRWLSAEPIQANLSASSEGSTGLSNLSHSFFKSMVIPVPPVEEQKAIARILDSVDTAIERTRETIQQAKRLRKSLISELLKKGIGKNGSVRRPQNKSDDFADSPLGKLPVVWKIRTVKDEFELQTGFTLNENRRPILKKRPYLRVANVQREFIDIADVKELEASDGEIKQRLLEENDLLIVEGHADRRQIGRCAIVNKLSEGLTFQNHLYRLRPCNGIDPYFACLWLNSEYAQKYWNGRCATSSGLNTINQRMLKQLTIPVPPKAEQKQISKIIKVQRKHTECLELKYKRLLTLKNSLMHDLLTGKIRTFPANTKDLSENTS